MFRLNAGETIRVYAPFGKVNGPNGNGPNSSEASVWWYDTQPWHSYVTKRETLLDKHEVIDAVALHNGRYDVKPWMAHNIQQGNTIIVRDGVYAMVKPSQLTFLD